jgi:serine/threonine protein phosphatase 1
MMILQLFEKFNKKNREKVYQLPEGWRVYAVGDIHGRADLLERLNQIIVLDSEAAPFKKNLLVYLGDYLDRGPFVRETLDLLISGLPSGFKTEYLHGNHEEFFLRFLEDPSILEMWVALGGQSTLMSYGVQVPGMGFSTERARKVREELLQAMPREHLEFLTNLKPFFVLGDFVFVHAGIRPGVPLDKQKPEDLFWIRDDFLNSPADHGYLVIHGHTIDEQVQKLFNRIGVDTGAYATGILSCAVLEGNRIRFLSTEA